MRYRIMYLTKNGRREFVVLTIEHYQQIKEALEDADDVRILREARSRNADSPMLTSAQVRHRLKLVHGKAAKRR